MSVRGSEVIEKIRDCIFNPSPGLAVFLLREQVAGYLFGEAFWLSIEDYAISIDG
jgi:hypothetical protein